MKKILAKKKKKKRLKTHRTNGLVVSETNHSLQVFTSSALLSYSEPVPPPPVERLRVREDFQVVGLPANDDLGIKAFSFAALLGSRETLTVGDKGKLFHVY